MTGAVSALLILDIKGRCLISRHYRGDISSVEAERFFNKLLENEEDIGAQGPAVFDNGVSHIFIRHNNVYSMVISRQNLNVASLVVFLHRLASVFEYYFEELEEKSLRDNFVVMGLLDEMMDFGYPQYTEATILSEFIKTDAYSWKLHKGLQWLLPILSLGGMKEYITKGMKYSWTLLKVLTY